MRGLIDSICIYNDKKLGPFPRFNLIRTTYSTTTRSLQSVGIFYDFIIRDEKRTPGYYGSEYYKIKL